MRDPALLPLAWRLAQRELRSGLRGFGVFLACLFLGVFAIAAIGSFSAAAHRGLLADARALLGGDLEIELHQRELIPEQRRSLGTRGEISEVVELRTMARVADGDRRALVELKAVDDAYPLYGALESLPPAGVAALDRVENGAFGALVEATLLQRLGVEVGATLEVGAARLRIVGVLTREPDRTLGAFSLGPRLLIGPAGLAATGLIQPGSLVNYAYRLRLPAGTDAAKVKTELQDSFPAAGWRVRTWEEAAPRVRRFLDRMTLNLTLVGLCALLVGGLGVAGAVRGYLDGKVVNIATMKCLGASGRTIFTGYLLQVLMLAALGAGFGVAAGATFPAVAVWLAGDRLPIPVQLGIYPLPLATAALFGLLISLVFSLQALGSARRIPPALLFRGYSGEERPAAGNGVRAAIVATATCLALLAVFSSSDKRLALWFIVGAVACFALFRGLALLVIAAARRSRRPRHPGLRLALANIHRPGSPAGSAIFSLGLGLTALVIVALVQANLTRLVTETVPAEAPAFFVLDLQPAQVAPFEALVAGLPGVTRHDLFPTLRGRIVAIAGTPVEQAAIAPGVQWAVHGDRYLSYSGVLPPGTELTAGSWWPADYSGPPLLSLTADLAKGFGVKVGDTLTVNVLGRNITATIASLRNVDWSTLQLNFALLFSPGVLEAAPHSSIATVYVPPAGEEAVFRAVTDRFPNVSMIGVREVLANVEGTLERIAVAFRAMAAVALLCGFLVLGGAVSADQHRRLRDAVIFKVCGATRGDLLIAFGAEFLLLGLAAGAIAALVGSLAAWAIVAGPMSAPFKLAPLTLLLTLVAGLSLTLFLGLAGTWRALGQRPAPWLREE